MFQAHVDRLTFTDGTSIALAADSILVVIGPNNAGKSVTLAGIASAMEEGKPSLALSEVRIRKVTPLSEVKEKMQPYQDASGDFRLPGMSFHNGALNHWWSDDLNAIGPFFKSKLLSYLSTRERLGDCEPAQPFEARAAFAATHPFQFMYRNEKLEKEASVVVRRAFKKDLVIHRMAGGGRIPAYVGKKPTLSKGETAISESYSLKVEALDRLEDQGDGLRSFVSVIGRLLTEARPMQVIDEPEAFLHPPQALLIGEEISRHSAGRQTFVATHSSDVLQGMLSTGGDRVSVVRLTRAGNFKVNYLPNSEIAELWQNPILRFGNVLDGLFHDGVIVTEADADCRFYEAFAKAVVPTADLPDIHYTYSGGKDRIPVLVKSLVALRVPVASVLDFDVLNSEQPLRRIVEAHGGDWSTVEADWKAVKAAVEAGGAFLSGDKFRTEVSALLKTYGQGVAVPKDVLSKVKKLARNASPWDQAKSSGLAGIATGKPTIAARRLIDTLAGMGIFVIPVGELEGFCRTIGGHGPRWVEEALKREIGKDAELEDARRFTSSIVDWLNKRRAKI
jgi:ABC-type cobalamin/Fe3+-siderophores transport system ATPase subunit